MLKRITKNHVAFRILCVLGLIFSLYLAINFTKGRDQLLAFLQEWKLAACFSFLAILFHTFIEVKTAIEDYVSNSTTRNKLIKITRIIAGLAGMAICLAIWRN